MAEATVEQIKTPEVRRASNALMLHIANGEFNTSKTNGLNKNPKSISEQSFGALQNHHDNTRRRQQNEFYDRMRKNAAEDPQFHRELTSQELRHSHFVTWAKIESIRIGAMFHQQRNSPEGQQVLKNALEKLHITLSDKVNIASLSDQLYDANSSSPGEFYTLFCTGNSNKKLIETLTQEDIIVLKDFLIDTLGSPPAYDALLATKQTQDAIDQSNDFSTNSSSLPMHEYGILDFFQKGTVLPSLRQEEEKSPETPVVLDKIDGGYTVAKPEHSERNDDVSFLDRDNMRGGIFDGAGGYTGGDKASRTAMAAVEEVMSRFPLKGDFPEAAVREQFVEAFALANERVKALGTGMTTAAVWQVVRSVQDGSSKLLVGNIGDSRVWIRHKDGSVTQVTRDGGELRSLHRKALREIPQGSTDPRFQEVEDEETQRYEGFQSILDNARSSADFAADPRLQAAFHLRNETDLLGADDYQERFEFFESPLLEGDTVFMTTDGVHDNLTKRQIEEIAQQTADPDELSRQLVTRARQTADTYGTTQQQFRAKPDDITAVALTLSNVGFERVDLIQKEQNASPSPEKIAELANQASLYMREKRNQPIDTNPGEIALPATGKDALPGAIVELGQKFPDVGRHFEAHGIAKGTNQEQLQALVNLLSGEQLKGTSTTTTLSPDAGQFTVYSDGGFIIISQPDKQLTDQASRVYPQFVAVNEQFYGAIATLQTWFPKVQFIRADSLPQTLQQAVQKT